MASDSAIPSLVCCRDCEISMVCSDPNQISSPTIAYLAEVACTLNLTNASSEFFLPYVIPQYRCGAQLCQLQEYLLKMIALQCTFKKYCRQLLPSSSNTRLSGIWTKASRSVITAYGIILCIYILNPWGCTMAEFASLCQSFCKASDSELLRTRICSVTVTALVWCLDGWQLVLIKEAVLSLIQHNNVCFPDAGTQYSYHCIQLGLQQR